METTPDLASLTSMNEHVTMRDIAKKLGVSVATVSLAMRNQPNVSPENRKLIQRTARQLGYRPNPYVSALMRSRRSGVVASGRPVLALVSGLALPHGWSRSPSATFRLIRKGALERAAARGYVTAEFSLAAGELSAARLSGILSARGLNGVLLGPLPDGAAIPALDWERLSSVRIGVPSGEKNFFTVTNDHYFGSMRVVEECRRLGYRRPGLLMRDSHRERFQGRWEAGFFNAQRMLAGIEATVPLFVENLEDPAVFPEQKFRAWLAREKPDVVISIAPELAGHFLRKGGLAVPRDIGIAGLACADYGGPVSGLCSNGELVGATAINLLIARVESNDRGPPPKAVATMVEGDWNPGTTLRRQG
jgi:DNA-binding LacI/PurR family transcriptional regulator